MERCASGGILAALLVSTAALSACAHQSPEIGVPEDSSTPRVARYDSFGLPGYGWGGKLGIIVFETKGQYFSGSHVEPLRYCPEERALKCIAFEDVELAVPRQGLKVGAEWQYNGRRYVASAETHLELLGAGFDVIIIDASRDDVVDNVFLFSPEHGLMAYSFLHANFATPSQTWFLRRPPGVLADTGN